MLAIFQTRHTGIQRYVEDETEDAIDAHDWGEVSEWE